MDTTHVRSNQYSDFTAGTESQCRGDQFSAAVAKAGPAIQEWIRLPRSPARCFVSGLSRSTLCKLILPSVENGFQPPVRSVVLKQRWAIRGIRLVSRVSLTNYLASLEGAPASRWRPNEESLADLIKQDEFEQKMMDSWEIEPEVPDRRRVAPLSDAARKCGQEFLRALQDRHAKAKPNQNDDGQNIGGYEK